MGIDYAGFLHEQSYYIKFLTTHTNITTKIPITIARSTDIKLLYLLTLYALRPLTNATTPAHSETSTSPI